MLADKSKITRLTAAYLSFTLILLYIGPFSLIWSEKSLVTIPTFVSVAIFTLSCIACAVIRKNLSERTFMTIILSVASVILLSDWPRRSFGLLESLSLSGLSGTHFVIASLTLGAISFFISSRLLTEIPFIISFLLSFFFLSALDYKLIFSDDHPTFLFRLISLKEAFPFVPSYNALWNAGIEFRDFFASGALGIYLLFFPLVQFFDVESVYNYILILLLFFLPILSAYITTKLFELDRKIFLIVAILLLSHSSIWYRWALSFGTLGFLLATQMFPILAGCAYKLSQGTKWNYWQMATAIISATLMLLWPISSLFLAPLVIYCLIFTKKIIFRKESWIILLVLLLINLPWMYAFSKVSAVEKFVNRQQNTTDGAIEAPINEAEISVKSFEGGTELKIDQMLTVARESLQAINPSILFLGFISIALFLPANMQILFALITAWFLFLALVGRVYKPQLELDRFLVVVTYALALPSAVAVQRTLDIFSKFKPSFVLARGVIFLMFFCSIFCAFRNVSNNTQNLFYSQEDIVHNLANAIQKHTPEGRAMFAGFTLHELAEGHLAPLIFYANTPLIARSYKHDHWEYHDVIPARYRSNKGKRVNEFLDLYNIRSIITHEKNWRNFFQRQTAKFKEVWHEGRFRILVRTTGESNYFYQGTGSIIRQLSDQVILKLNTPDAVIKFNYIEGLEIDRCKVEAFNVEGPVNLISLKHCPINEELIIKAKSPLKRFLLQD